VEIPDIHRRLSPVLSLVQWNGKGTPESGKRLLDVKGQVWNMTNPDSQLGRAFFEHESASELKVK
jgi:hypothetical protein